MKNLFLIFLTLCILSCKDKRNHWYVKQLSLKFAISDTNILFKLYPKDSISFGYYAKNLVHYDSAGIIKEMKYVIISRNDKDDNPKYYISIGDIAWISSGQNIKNYLIIWPNGETDTLYADYRKENTPYHNNCSCGEPLMELRLNGKPYVRKTNYDINGIYIFDR